MFKFLKQSLAISAGLFIVAADAGAQTSDGLVTAKNQFVEAGGVKFAYRKFGKESAVPVILLQHFTGTNDYWDPQFVDKIAQERTVIVFNYRGVGLSTGHVADSVDQITQDSLDFIQSLGYKKVDVLGFSLGGFVAQELAAAHPELVRKVVIAGASNKGGGDHLLKVLGEAFSQKDSPDPRVYLFFTESQKSKNAGSDFVKRSSQRAERDPESGKEIADAQAKAIITWANTPDPDNTLLKSIRQPVLILQGAHDKMFDSENSYKMTQAIPNAQLILYPDAAHGSIFQYAQSAATSVNAFLSE